MIFSFTRREIVLISTFAIIWLFTAPAQWLALHSPTTGSHNGGPLNSIGSLSSFKSLKSISWSSVTKIFSSGETREDSPLFLNRVRTRWGNGVPLETKIIAHFKGATILDRLYTLNGTLFIVTDDPASVPEPRFITSSGKPGSFDPDDTNWPTDKHLRIVSTREARAIFGPSAARMEGVTFMSTDPCQFLTHYFHFVIEVFMHNIWRLYATLDPFIAHDGTTVLDPPSRFIFTNCGNGGWRDRAGLNAFFLRTAFPGMAIEQREDWIERADIGSRGKRQSSAEEIANDANGHTEGYPNTARAIVMDRVVLADRAAWKRDPGAFKNPDTKIPYVESLHYWSPIRQAVVEYSAGTKEVEWPGERKLHMLMNMDEQDEEGQEDSEKPLIAYISRQKTGRKLKTAHHEALVQAVQSLADENGYEFKIPLMEEMSKFDQIYLASRSTILLGVHGNGLSSGIWMKPNRQSAIIDGDTVNSDPFSYGSDTLQQVDRESFVYDYHSVGDGVGIRHWEVQNDTVMTGPDHPELNFGMIHVPTLEVQAPVVTNIIHERLERALYDPRFPPPKNPVAWWSAPHPEPVQLGAVEEQLGYSPSDREDFEAQVRAGSLDD